MVPRMVWVSRHAGRQSLFRPHCSGCDLAHDVSADPVPGRPRRQLAVRALDRFKRPTVSFRPSLRRSLAEFNYMCVVGFTKESDLRARFIVWSSLAVSSRAAAAVHALSVGVFSKLSPAATLWSDRLGISATYSRGRARGRRDLPCSQRGPAQPKIAAARRQVGGKNSIFHPSLGPTIPLASFVPLLNHF